MKKWCTAATVLLLVYGIYSACAYSADRDWNNPVPPFRIAQNLYYVGASDLTSFLITTSQGHILLDGGLPETAPQIERNIKSLGFKMTDVKFLVNSHAHYDHAGGLAELKRVSGAKLVASKADRPALEAGDKNDFAWGHRFAFKGVNVDRVISDGETLPLGEAKLTAHITPGHTRGCTTWTTAVSDAGKSYNVVFLCSVSVPGYDLINNLKYPDIISDYRQSFGKLRALPCDIFLAAHGSFFELAYKRAAVETSHANPFVVPGEYQSFLDKSEREFNALLREQQAAKR